MARGQDKFCWTVFTVLALSHHYFRANIVEWEIITVITMKTLAYDVQTLKVRNILRRINVLADYYKSVIASFYLLLTSMIAYLSLQTFLL